MRIWIFLFLTVVCSCENASETTILKDTNQLKITYDASPKYGYSVKAVRTVDPEQHWYIFQLNRNGDILAVYKYSVHQLNDKSYPDVSNPIREFLVSDTSRTGGGPSLSGNEIISFYNNSQANKISSNNYKGQTISISVEDSLLLEEVEKLMKMNQFNFNAVKLQFFWFKFEV